jgi:gamma-glutamylcyclotransferase (GGCT)/AIG2-like uncharacterized protein YtfP
MLRLFHNERMMPNNGPASANPIQERCVFVYGTLRRGQANDINRLVPPARFLGCARVSGTLYQVAWYPGLVLGQAEDHAIDGAAAQVSVVGEVYAIGPELERQLDQIEEVYPQQRDEYFKREVLVELLDAEPAIPTEANRAGLAVATQGPVLRCLVYEINPKYIVGKPVIASGDWVKR